MSAGKTIQPPSEPDALKPVLLPTSEPSQPHVIDPANIIANEPVIMTPASMAHAPVSGKVPGKLASLFTDDQRQILKLALKISAVTTAIAALFLLVFIVF